MCEILCENIPLPKGAFWESETWSVTGVILHHFIAWDKSMGRKQDENEEVKETAQQARDWDTEQEDTRLCWEQEPHWRQKKRQDRDPRQDKN